MHSLFYLLVHYFLLFYSDYEAGARQIDGSFFGHLKQPVRGEMIQQLYCPLCLKVFPLQLEYTDLWPLCSVQSKVVERKKFAFKSWKCQCERCVQPTSYIKLKCLTCIKQSCLNSILVYPIFQSKQLSMCYLLVELRDPVRGSSTPQVCVSDNVEWAHHTLQFGFAWLTELWAQFKGSYDG